MIRKLLLLSVAISLWNLAGCGESGSESADLASREMDSNRYDPHQPSISSQAFPQGNGTKANALFSSIEDHAIKFVNCLHPESEVVYLTNGSGVAIGDLDNDGQPDVFLCGLNVGNKVYRQTDAFRFDDVTKDSGINSDPVRCSSGCAMADVNNDGLLDIYVCNYLHRNELYINEGNFVFSEQADTWNLDYEGPSTMASFADFDRDGDLDLYLVNNRRHKVENEDYRGRVGRTANGEIIAPPDMFLKMNGRLIRSGHKDLLFENRGDCFEDVTDKAGIVGYGMGLSATWCDTNSDNWPDLWVANDLKTPDHLYVNQGNGTFKDVLPESVSYTTWNSMGSDFADFNNDGLFDIFVADMSATTHLKEKINMGDMSTEAWFLATAEPRQIMRNCLYINSGSGPFLETAYFSRVARTDWTWSVKCADFDCDGLEDIFVTNGKVGNSNDSDWLLQIEEMVRAGKENEARRIKPPNLEEENQVLRNIGGLKFENVSKTWGLAHHGISHGAAVGDLDGDGDLDLIVQNYGENVSVYRNEASHNRITVSLRGSASNSMGIGSTVTVKTPVNMRKRLLSTARGYLSSDEPILHFGLGSEEQIELLQIEWPSGIVQQFENLPVNRHFEIREPAADDNGKPAVVEDSTKTTLFVRSPEYLRFRHRELPFDDFSIQKLLPNELSSLGPGIAWADINSDGLADAFVGGAAGQAGQLQINRGQGVFQEMDGPWRDSPDREDMGIAWLDVDRDGDLDLYVGSGGYENELNSPVLRDRLYLNDGKSSFVDVTDQWLPDFRESTSCVRPGDFDNDGDLDLFVGSRLVPGQYPRQSNSLILRNEETHFVSCGPDFAGDALGAIGLVTDAVWTDFDNDGLLDLVIVSEWGRIEFLRNTGNGLTGITDKTVLSDVYGWWNGICAADIDGNGYDDYVISNFGTNTKYGQPSRKKPRKLFFGDMNNNGAIDLVEAKVATNDELLPVRGRSCSCQQMPELAEKFPSYRSFASAMLDEIYALEKSNELICNELRTVLVLNRGNGEFELMPLPDLAQLAPVFGAAVHDFDLDGHLDLLLAQNFYGPQIETGRMSGGLGAFMRGRGDGSFEEFWPDRSGVVIPENARSISVVDLDNDADPDVVVTVSNGEVINLINNASPENRRCFRVTCRGPAGNPSGIGSIVSLCLPDGKELVRDRVDAQSGYLANSPADVFLATSDLNERLEVKIVWPDGSSTASPAPADGGHVVMSWQATPAND